MLGRHATTMQVLQKSIAPAWVRQGSAPLQSSQDGSSPTLAFDPNMLPVVPPGTVALLTLLGHGTQNYTCIANGAHLQRRSSWCHSTPQRRELKNSTRLALRICHAQL